MLGCEEQGLQKLVAYVSPAPGSDDPQAGELRQFLAEKLPNYMVPSSVVVLDALNRLPNGKVDTRALVAMDPPVQSTACAISSHDPETELEQALIKIWMEVLGTNDVRVDDNFFEIGGDSIMSIRIVALSREMGITVTPNDLMANQTISELATVAGWEKAKSTSESEEDVSGMVPLTPIQHWFFELGLRAPEHWNQAMLVDVPANIDSGNLEAAILAVFAHHDILRAQFYKNGDAWEQRIPPADVPMELGVSVVQLAPEAVAEHLAQLNNDIRLDNNSTPLARFALFCNESGESHTFAMIMHHLIVDNISWRILLEDLATGYQQVERGADISLPAKTTSYKQWAEHLATTASSGALNGEVDYWTKTLPEVLAKMPTDCLVKGALIEGDSRMVRVKFPKDQTESLLRDANTAYNTRAHDLLIVALVQTLLKWAGGESLRLGLEGFGRDPFEDSIEVTRSVGWFTAFYTLTLQLDPATMDETAIKAIKEQLRSVPNRGIGYGLLRYLSGDGGLAEAMGSLPREEVLFNYLGTLPKIDPDRSGPVRSVRSVSDYARASENQRSHLLEINAYVDEGELELLWTYNIRAHSRETIEKLGAQYVENLSRLISHCLAAGSGGYTPSDFPDAGLDQVDLDRFLDSIG